MRATTFIALLRLLPPDSFPQGRVGPRGPGVRLAVPQRELPGVAAPADAFRLRFRAAADIRRYDMANALDRVSRRAWLELMLAGGATLATGDLSKLFAQTLRPETPHVILGPFYPLVRPLDRDADLTKVRGRKGQASGQVIHVTGRVFDRNGDPVRKARIELWQANARGRYDHPSDPNTDAPLDPNFQGFGVQMTDGDGWYRFKTVKPGPYPSPSGEYMRAPHLHFDIQGRVDRKVTQMMFPGEPLNATDRVYLAVRGGREALIAEVAPAENAGELLMRWDITLARG